MHTKSTEKAERDALANCIYSMFLADGLLHTIKEIAANITWSQSKVRRVMKDNDAELLDDVQELWFGKKQPALYCPTKKYLRKRILDLMAQQPDPVDSFTVEI